MFTLVDYVRLSQEYIRGRFVLKQRQFLIGRAASVQIPALIHPWIIVQFNLVNGKVFQLSIDSFTIVFMFFSHCLQQKIFLYFAGSKPHGLFTPNLC